MKVFFKTFGCRTNLFDTQVMRENLQDFQYTQNEDEAQIIVINSCTVTNGADASVRSYINKISKQGKKIYFTGCGVKTKGKSLFGLVNGVFDHSFKENINSLLKMENKFFYEDDKESKHIDNTLVCEFVGKSRAFIKIQEGCDFACSYCIIPYARGKARSFLEERILEQIRLLANNGIQEVVLTGTNVGSYGKDTGTNISKLIKNIAKLDGIKRIRVGSLEPSQIDEEFLEIMGESFLEKHLHIALQHSQDEMLELMNRQNRFQKDLGLLEKIASKGLAIGTDFIVGHPGESDLIWESAYKNLELMPLTHIHPFIYSPRESTPSATMQPTINGEIAKQRLHLIKNLIKNKNIEFRKKIQQCGTPLEVIIEGSYENQSNGLDQFFNKVKIQNIDKKDGLVIINDYKIQEEQNFARGIN